MIEWVWVKMLGDGGHDPAFAGLPPRDWPDDKGNYRVSLPREVWFDYDDSIVDDLISAINVPLTTWLRIGVDSADIGKIGVDGKDWYREDDARVDAKSRIATDMVRTLRGAYTIMADAFFDPIAITDETARVIVNDVLLQGAARGIPESTTRRIRDAKALPATDAEIRDAAEKYQIREHKLTLEKAREVLDRKLAAVEGLMNG